jgi:integrase
MTKLPPYVYRDDSRHGQPRLYFWKGRGHRKLRILEARGTEAFQRRYRELLTESATGGHKMAPRDAPSPNTLRWLCGLYFASAEARSKLEPHTLHVSRLIVDKMMAEPIAPGASAVFGDCPLNRFGRDAVEILRDRRADKPEAANNRLRRLHSIFNWAVKKRKLTGVTENPAVGVERLRPHRVGGFPTWTAADVEKFEDCHAIGTKPRLALALMLYLGVRRSDLTRLGRQHVRNGEITFRPHKGRKRSARTITLPILPDLQRILDASPTGDLTYLVTEYGKPFTDAGFTNWFRARCNQAGLVGLSAHGLRKEAATRMAENGAPAHALLAVFGWQKIEMAETYTRAADQKRLSRAGALLLARNETG